LQRRPFDLLRMSWLPLLAFLLLQFSGDHGFQPYSKPWKVTMAVNGLLFLVIFCLGAFKTKTSEVIAKPFVIPECLYRKYGFSSS